MPPVILMLACVGHSRAALYSLISLLACVGHSRAALYSLKDTRPGLAGLNWWEGGPAFALASAGAVRLNFRGLYVYPAKSTMRPLHDLGWHEALCNASAWALCAADVGQVLPQTSPRLSERRETVTADGWDDLGCSDSRGKTLVSLGVYDISACDIFDEGLDLVYAQGEAGGRIYHRHSTLELWEYWLLVVLSIVIVRFLSYNIQALWDTAPDNRPQLPALISALLAVLVVLVDGDCHFVTSADQVSASAFFCLQAFPARSGVGPAGLFAGLSCQVWCWTGWFVCRPA